MKTKLIITSLIAVFLSNCNTPRYLPLVKDIGVNEYGSYINLNCNNNLFIRGELIEIDSNKIIVLNKSTNKCETYPIRDVQRFKLKYARARDYSWTIPISILATISHGFFLAISLPVNLIVTISVNGAFKYSEKDMTYDKLKMFARFPQGIPPNIDISSIK
jgi:hypothetical protein